MLYFGWACSCPQPAAERHGGSRSGPGVELGRQQLHRAGPSQAAVEQMRVAGAEWFIIEGKSQL